MAAYTPDDVLPAPQRRVRHITALQVRNLTPFPVRDMLAKTLIQPGSNTPNTSILPQKPVDDIELVLTPWRRRRVSSTSLRNPDVDVEESPNSTATHGKKGKVPKGNIHSARSMAVTPGNFTNRQRARTNSKASTPTLLSAPPFLDSVDAGFTSGWDGMPISGGLSNMHSQRDLEKIFSTRLVETFITLTLPSPPISSNHLDSQQSPPSTRSSASIPSSSRKPKGAPVGRALSASVTSHRRGISTSSSASSLSMTSPAKSKRPHSSSSLSSNPSRTQSGIGGHATIPSSSRVAEFPSPPPTPPRSPPRRPLTPSTSTHLSDQISDIGRKDNPQTISTPFFISYAHPPSTNPRFSNLDPERDFAPWTDLSATHVKVAIWSRNHSPDKDHGKESKGKGKAVAYTDGSPVSEKDSPPWRKLEEWDVNLDDMEPFSDVADRHLPSNTLLLTVASGTTFRLLPPALSVLSHVPSPPELDYDSDGGVDEVRLRTRRQEESEDRRREREALEKSRRETRMKLSACWQDLVKIVNMQACIVDTKDSMEEIIQNCNLLVEGDGYEAALREVSAREERLRSLRSELEEVVQDSLQVRDVIETRRKALDSRRVSLAAARAIHEEGTSECAARNQEVEYERQRHGALVSSLSPLRIGLIQAVNFIFPIEPLSGPDLLFTILGATLPIPVSSSDPAPPLSLASHPEVTEDNTATALGYVAQVVQLISVYLGKGLVYPVTCCGSRSVIKDMISAMMGPRIFPLYSKGVETYRFEYGVFLLNKDIEMLMTDRDLRAMDMRHTLPNLKNLLLTLTTGETPKRTLSTATASSRLQSSVHAISRLVTQTSQLTLHQEVSPKTAGSIISRKSAPLLSPLASILRARYPSTAVRPTVKVVHESPEPAGSEAEPAGPMVKNDTAASDGEECKTIETNDNASPSPSVSVARSSLEKVAIVDGLSSPSHAVSTT